jgi:hypothetical protein
MPLGKIVYDYAQQTWHQKLYLFALYTSYLVLGLSFIGIHYLSPEYEKDLNLFIKYYIAAILLFRFNPFVTTPKHGNFDRQIAFSAGLLLLLTNAGGFLTLIGNIVL